MAAVRYVSIGSGISALVAVALLSAKGHRVTVLERGDTPGGCLKSEPITLPGFHHDVMATTFVLFLTSPAFGELGEVLGRHGLELCHTPQPTTVLHPDGTSLVLTTGTDLNKAAIETYAQGDGTTLAVATGKIDADADFLFSLLGAPLWSWKTTRLLLGQWRRKGLLGLKSWFGESLRPARVWLEKDFEAPLTRALLAPWPLHAGLSPETAYSKQMAKVIAFALHSAGAPIVKGGASQAVAAFAAWIEAILSAYIRNYDKTKLARTDYSPADLEAMNINLVNGNHYGGDCAIDQFFVWRRFTSTRNAATKVSGLNHIGASTHPGPGLGGGSGYNLAKSLGA